jgi:hypothetical protein
MNHTPKSTSTASIFSPFFLPSGFVRLLARAVIPQLSGGNNILAAPLTATEHVALCNNRTL